MREILFRGKRTFGGEWIYGFYFIEKGKGSFIKELPSSVFNATCLINPETVGQYTGVTDRNGKKIFEGDIVKTKTDICVIVWQGLGFIAKKPNKRPMCWQYVMCGGEIIGNIYDTPELISQPE